MWRQRARPDLPVSRQMMMVALQNLQGIYLRGTYAIHVHEAR